MSSYEAIATKYRGRVEKFARLNELNQKRDTLIRELKNSIVHELLTEICARINGMNPQGDPFKIVHALHSEELTGCPRYKTHSPLASTYAVSHGYAERGDKEQWIEPATPIIGYWVLERGTHDTKKMWFLTASDGMVYFIARSGRLYELPTNEVELFSVIGMPSHLQH